MSKAFYALVLERSGTSPVWCWLCQLGKTEWKTQTPTGAELWTIELMEDKKLAEGNNGAERKGMVDFLI
jgi:hypothetical protein